MIVEPNVQAEYDWMNCLIERRWPMYFYLRSGPLVAQVLEAGLYVYHVQLKTESNQLEQAIIYKHAVNQIRMGAVTDEQRPPSTKLIPSDRLESLVLRDYLSTGKDTLYFLFSNRYAETAKYIELGPYSYVVNTKRGNTWHATLINKIAVDCIILGRNFAY